METHSTFILNSNNNNLQGTLHFQILGMNIKNNVNFILQNNLQIKHIKHIKT